MGFVVLLMKCSSACSHRRWHKTLIGTMIAANERLVSYIYLELPGKELQLKFFIPGLMIIISACLYICNQKICSELFHNFAVRNAASIMEMGKVCKIQLVTQVSTSIPDYKSELPKS